MTPLPHDYQWADAIVGPPKLFVEMRAMYGLLEAPGDADNPVILAMAHEAEIDGYNHDSIAWCGLAMAVACRRAGKQAVAAPLWALNWQHFGQPVSAFPKSPQASFGDVLVFHRPGGGHVGLYVAEDATAYHVLGGNEHDSVAIVPVLKARCVAVRRPIWSVAQPASVIPHHVARSGALSSNEA